MGRILVGIGGGISAYKVCELVSRWVQAGHQVRVVLTPMAERFITPLTVSTLSRHPAYTDGDFWQATGRPLHIELGEWAEVILVAPLTADLLAKIAHGQADDLLTNTLLASTAPVLVAPAMNATMWQQLSVQSNYKMLLQWPRFHSVGTRSGLLACDAVGPGRMAEPEEIYPWVESLLITGGQRDLCQYKILVTAGGTREYLDPVRFLGNPATGAMGLALAQAANHRGAQVTLIHAPVSQRIPPLEAVVPVTSGQAMYNAVMAAFPAQDWCLMAAAVGDVQPGTYHPHKLRKRDLPDCLPLAPVPDILQALSNIKQPHQLLVGFAAQTGEIEPPAWEKLIAKKLDAIVANPVDQAQAGFGSSTNWGIWLDRQGQRLEFSLVPKLTLAHQILTATRSFYSSASSGTSAAGG
ncbi:phosphopantothenate-cysteine ligase [Gloeomargarita lithophora Alchichica-D10]|uniref:Coenzyme A biosynthesis bifunctional protein CoaBC n=1 Tax=Gloeomargarita lithophora Alchichica-D10 TaxID=1188229 RepID=A0A1J0AES1_9CYAN|nr:bifunctional phosphopantothenoylcysteine decarboxylase/phosphopantothenate--cysteine ligase CoaBC [Gloeomargarita lithophora]APB34436.1 phosphopantothenate-cysteine ligase [Gloeomargarita lithophora Alchichica-D10]